MQISSKLLGELQQRLKVGNRRGVHLNGIPGRSVYKFDLHRLSKIEAEMPKYFVDALLSFMPLRFRISWKGNVKNFKKLEAEEQHALLKINKSLENLVNQTEAIESEKGINTFAFGFPLLVRKGQKDNKLTVSPILIWSLRIKRSKDFNTWVVQRKEDDPIYINEVLINHLKADAGVEIEQISREVLDDGLVDKAELARICADILKTVNTDNPADLEESILEELNEIKAVPDKKNFELKIGDSHNAFLHFGGLFSIFEVQKQSIIDDYEQLHSEEELMLELDPMQGHYFQSISSVETDPSQQGILHALESRRNILIQGPPGTGKSQSLTAVLINALENGKKTIVVCEKRTALEVLQKAMVDKGLHHLCVLIKDIIRDRRAVVNSVRERVDDSSFWAYKAGFNRKAIENIVLNSRELIDDINAKHRKVGSKLFENQDWTGVVGTWLRELRTHGQDVKLALPPNFYDFSNEEYKDCFKAIRKGEILYKAYFPLMDQAFLNPFKLTGNSPFQTEQTIKASFEDYGKELQVIASLSASYHDDYRQLRQAEFAEQKEQLEVLIDKIEAILAENKENPDFIDQKWTEGRTFAFLAFFTKKRKKTLADQATFLVFFQELVDFLMESLDYPAVAFSSVIVENIEVFQGLKEHKFTIETNFETKVNTELETLNFFTIERPYYQSTIQQKLKEKADSLQERIILDNWIRGGFGAIDQRALEEKGKMMLERQATYFDSEDDVFAHEFAWYSFYNGLSTKTRTIIDDLLNKKDWRKHFLIDYFYRMLAHHATNELPTHEHNHKELEEELSKLGEEQIKYIKELWYAKQLTAKRQFEADNPMLAVANLYNKRSGRKFKRLSLRQIIKKDIDLFTTFFPIVFVTPDVCSNLFKGKNNYFDIVLFDEASQLRLEDTLPAILKGKQKVIAGDEHQMPPSNFFSKIFDGTYEDEDDIEEEDEIIIDRDNMLLSCESLLDFGTELNFEKSYLDFHYRSKHPYLIDFSNHAFYNRRLKPLPNHFDYTPIKYFGVNGTYQGHANEAEADKVLEILDKHIKRFPNGEYPSVGIATFNISQRNLIKSKIVQRRLKEKYAEFNEKVIELEAKGLFVKNLENIQGDERDVIILSTTYGLSPSGRFFQRFGPINHKKGYKLLNVIVTRAKYKIYACSSVPEEIFLNYKDYLITEGANNRRAVFFAYLAYAKAVSENDETSRQAVLSALSENAPEVSALASLHADLESVFEEEVYQLLLEHHAPENIIPQLKFAGFRIDMVFDHQLPGVPRIAIECDGAKYHSSREAYLHDSHRQKILESHGFVFHRIWSTLWWRNPNREMKKLLRFIESVKEEKADLVRVDEAQAFLHEVD